MIVYIALATVIAVLITICVLQRRRIISLIKELEAKPEPCRDFIAEKMGEIEFHRR
jgi:hypothetical protein